MPGAFLVRRVSYPFRVSFDALCFWGIYALHLVKFIGLKQFTVSPHHPRVCRVCKMASASLLMIPVFFPPSVCLEFPSLPALYRSFQGIGFWLNFWHNWLYCVSVFHLIKFCSSIDDFLLLISGLTSSPYFLFWLLPGQTHSWFHFYLLLDYRLWLFVCCFPDCLGLVLLHCDCRSPLSPL